MAERGGGGNLILPLAAAGSGVKKRGAAGEAKAAAGRQVRGRQRQAAPDAEPVSRPMKSRPAC